MSEDPIEKPNNMTNAEKLIIRDGNVSHRSVRSWRKQTWRNLESIFRVGTNLYRQRLMRCVVDGQLSLTRVHQAQDTLVEEWKTSGVIASLLLP